MHNNEATAHGKLNLKSLLICWLIILGGYLLIRMVFLVFGLQLHLTAQGACLVLLPCCFGALYLCMGGGDLARTSMLQAAIPPALRATAMSVDSLLCRLGAMLSSGAAAMALGYVGVPALWTGLGLVLAVGIGVQLLCGVPHTAGLSAKG